MYGATNPTFTGQLVGVVTGDVITATYASNATSTTAIGTYGPATPEAITPTLVDADDRLGNYAVTTTKGTLTIAADGGDAVIADDAGTGGGCGLGSAFGAALLAFTMALRLNALRRRPVHA